MASALWNPYKQDLLDRVLAIDYDTDAIQCLLGDLTDYTFVASHDFRDSSTGLDALAVAVAADANFGAKTVTDGQCDAGDLTYTAVTGDATDFLAIYKNVGTAATDPLLAFIDGFTPVTPNGGAITVTWDSGAERIFAF